MCSSSKTGIPEALWRQCIIYYMQIVVSINTQCRAGIAKEMVRDIPGTAYKCAFFNQCSGSGIAKHTFPRTVFSDAEYL